MTTIELDDMESEDGQSPREVPSIDNCLGDKVALELMRGVVEGFVIDVGEWGVTLEVDHGNSPKRTGMPTMKTMVPELFPWQAINRVVFVEWKTETMVERGTFDPYFFPDDVVAAAEAQTAAELAAEAAAESAVPVVPVN